MTVSIELAREGFRRASSYEEKVHEAAVLFGKGRNSANALAQAVLLEAFTTSDFPVLLGDAFEKTAMAAYKDTPFEFDALLHDVTVPDFKRRKLVDLWGADAFEKVEELEEYKGGALQETELEHGASKTGRLYGLSWELRLAKEFEQLANFPKALGNGARKGENNAVADLLTQANGWSTDYFGQVQTVAFSPEALDAAIKELAQRTNHRDELVGTANLVLVHGPALRGEVNRVLNAARITTEVTSGSKVTKTETDNPFRGLVTPLESRTVGARLGTAATGWALVQGKASDLPSIIRTKLAGHPDVDIRVKRDGGQYMGGGEVPYTEGSFTEDAIWYRGRAVNGIDPGFTTGVYASNGAA